MKHIEDIEFDLVNDAIHLHNCMILLALISPHFFNMDCAVYRTLFQIQSIQLKMKSRNLLRFIFPPPPVCIV